jgi:hypothetical protein
MAYRFSKDILNSVYDYAQVVDAADEIGGLFVQARVPASDDGCEPQIDERTEHFRIVIVRPTEVIVEGSVFDKVGTPIPDTADELGLQLKRIPLTDVMNVLTGEEVDQHDACVDADQAMLDNAY